MVLPALNLSNPECWHFDNDAAITIDDEILVSAQGPLVLGFGVLGLRVWGLGLTILSVFISMMGLYLQNDCLRLLDIKYGEL